jgi:crotonobetainyl-CoA:carnitine CoA-transferase CaiB-like acyl-CoA transferase
VRELTEVVADRALADRGMIQEAVVGEGAAVSLFNLPWKLDGGRPPLRHAPPRLGQHTAEFRARFG